MKRRCQELSVCNKMNLLKLLLFGLCYFLWARECETNEENGSKDWFETHGLSCAYCKKKVFNVLLNNSFKETTIRPRDVVVSVTPRRKKCTLDKRFLSFTLDALELMRKLRCFPLTSVKINNLVGRLAPAYFRVGGTPQDFLYFRKRTSITKKRNKKAPMQQNRQDCTPKFENWQKMKRFSLSLHEFDQLLNFTVRNKLDFIFGLNAKTRDRKGEWDDTNAKIILNHVMNRRNVHWTLGNEPNRFTKYGRKSEVSSSQLAQDFRKLRKHILKHGGGKILGPDISRPNKKSLAYYKHFLKHNPPIDAATYHCYNMHQSKGTRQSFLNPIFLDKLREEMEWITNSTKPNTDIWVGETGSASGGGAPNLSDRFISGFLYLGKIGLVTELCHKVFIRQSFYGGYYGMLDPITRDPLPDYWSSLLFKELIGTVVLSVQTNNADPKFRVYAYCSRKSTKDIVLMFINMNQNNEKTLRINELKEKHLELYILTNKYDLQSRDVYLNDELLELNNKSYEVPDLKPLFGKQPLDIPRLSYGFVVVKDVNIEECFR